MDVAYQVTWRESDGLETLARLRLVPEGVRLEPLEGQEPRLVLFEEIAGVDLEPSGDGSTGLTLALADGGEIELASNVSRWILSDLVAAFFAHRLGTHHDRHRVLVRARLRPGRGAEARRLLESGPPFDPSSTALVLHEAFVLDDEALFLFETNGDDDLLGLSRPDFWQAAGAWSELIAGSVRIAEPAYSWARGARAVLAEAHPGLGL